MNKLFVLLIVVLFTGAAATAKGRPAKVVPEVNSKFRTNLLSMLKVSVKPGGIESLKQVELTTGRWTCKMELDGFLPVAEVNAEHPADRWQIFATSVTPVAQKNAQMLVLKGIPGYTMRDSDNDKTVPIDRTSQTRKVIFKKTDKAVESTVTVTWSAHQYSSVQILVEAWGTYGL